MKILFLFSGGREFMAAVFENKTIAEIRELIINSFQTKFNKTFRLLPKSFVKVIASVFAGVYIILHKQIGWLFLQLFPETAYWEAVNILGIKVRPLVKWGILIGVGEPRNGSQWKGNITVSVSRNGTALAAGTQLLGDITGKLYITERGVFLEGDTVTAPVICADTGTAGNLESGDTLSFVSPLGTVRKTAVVDEVTSYAVEDETEAEYRARVVSRFRSPPMGGALSDYRRWASDVPGVLNTYPCQDTESASGVLVYVAGIPSLFPDRVPTPDLLRQVGRACTYDPATGKATRKPITAVLDPDYNDSYRNIKSVNVIAVDIYIEGISGAPILDFGDVAKPAIENYLMGREPYIRGLSDDNNKTNIVSRNNILSVVDQTSISLKAEFSNVTMYINGAMAVTYTLSTGELVKPGNLYLNGGLYG
jgi:uncharacterized phage protein gp47/JayE